MTDYEQLAVDLTAAGIKSDTARAYRVACAVWEGRAVSCAEAAVVSAWEARTPVELSTTVHR